MSVRRLLALALVVPSCAVASCTYRLTLTATPAASVRLPPKKGVEEAVVATPATVALKWVPFGKQPVVVTAPGHRVLSVDLRRHDIRLWALLVGTVAHPDTLWGRSRGEVRFVLIPDHGPAGTWLPDDL